jgi:hypothetical protein
MAAAGDAAGRRTVTARSLAARIANAERRVGIKVGIAALSDDELVATIEALQRIEASREAGANATADDMALAHRAVELYAETGRRG